MSLAIVSSQGRSGVAFWAWRQPSNTNLCHGSGNSASVLPWQRSPRTYPLDAHGRYPADRSPYDVLRFQLADRGTRAVGVVKAQRGCRLEWLSFSIPRVRRKPLADGTYRATNARLHFNLQFKVSDYGRYIDQVTGSYPYPACSLSNQPGEPRDVGDDALLVTPDRYVLDDSYLGRRGYLLMHFYRSTAGKVDLSQGDLNPAGSPRCQGYAHWNVVRAAR